jgi:hypothetical protein
MTSFDFFRSLVCGHQNKYRPGVTRVQLLKIALLFAESRTSIFMNDPFKYKASHIINDNYDCMQVQVKVFDLSDGREVHELKIPEESKGISPPPGFVTVREIAFGQEVDETEDPHPGLYFDIPEYQVQEASDEKIKMLKRAKNSGKKGMRKPFSALYDSQFPVINVRKGSFCGLDAFILKTLKFELSCLETRLPVPKTALEEEFRVIKTNMQLEHWPRNKGCEFRRASDQVPPVESQYEPSGKNEKLWNQHISIIQSLSAKQAWNRVDVPTDPKRLHIFGSLMQGEYFSEG